MGIAHFAFDFGARYECRNRVNDENIDSAGAYEHVGDFKRLLARVRLGDQKVIGTNAELAGIADIERVFCVDIGCDSALLLDFSNRVEGESRFPRGFRAVNFDDPAAGVAADSKRQIKPE